MEKPPVEIQYGSLVNYDGHMYAVAGIQATHNMDGLSVSFTCYDPFIMTKWKMEREAKQQAMDCAKKGLQLAERELGESGPIPPKEND